jgi:predicted lipoprotein
MSIATGGAARRRAGTGVKAAVGGGVLVALLVGMALDTTVVRIGSDADTRQGAFSPESYGAAEFPKVREAIEARAVDVATLAPAVVADKAAAGKRYGVEAGGTPVISVKFSGVAGESKAGIYAVAVPGLPEGVGIRVQTGPAINGTELRDATGTIAFGQFTNQIEYQNAGSALNNEMKREVLSKVDTKALSGKTVSVVGAFKLVNPKNWLVTPVRLDVQ